MGKVIVIEGLDGSGKQTQTEKLYNRTSYMSLFTPHPGGKKQNCVGSTTF